ncbi:hypothetical protein AHA02nite_07590 [Alkalibacillus haloalkaliphilus]|uniref:Uncharacterized protein n=1 Tax=Alkalibacillus haloalkaliphilus TaxID=94136 RepID=A0A511W4N8_9BACI|nr:hypothetical protein AHA02nite_07590 [Alkalibacillus haloalkaliphilus]
MLIDNIPNKEEISPNRPGRLYLISYSKYQSLRSSITISLSYQLKYMSKFYRHVISIINYFNINEKVKRINNEI